MTAICRSCYAEAEFAADIEHDPRCDPPPVKVILAVLMGLTALVMAAIGLVIR
ncbi:MAG: hypothetical protein KF809_17425 [Chloroflexi bacterium]|nr:hypothetical protein [Chloroflexota bacterium]